MGRVLFVCAGEHLPRVLHGGTLGRPWCRSTGRLVMGEGGDEDDNTCAPPGILLGISGTQLTISGRVEAVLGIWGMCGQFLV